MIVSGGKLMHEYSISTRAEHDEMGGLPVLRRKACAAWKIGSGNVRPGMALGLDGLEQALVLI